MLEKDANPCQNQTKLVSVLGSDCRASLQYWTCEIDSSSSCCRYFLAVASPRAKVAFIKSRLTIRVLTRQSGLTRHFSLHSDRNCRMPLCLNLYRRMCSIMTAICSRGLSKLQRLRRTGSSLWSKSKVQPSPTDPSCHRGPPWRAVADRYPPVNRQSWDKEYDSLI